MLEMLNGMYIFCLIDLQVSCMLRLLIVHFLCGLIKFTLIRSVLTNCPLTVHTLISGACEADELYACCGC